MNSVQAHRTAEGIKPHRSAGTSRVRTGELHASDSVQVTGLEGRLDADVLHELLRCDEQTFIRRAYWVLLGREPDSDGLANYLGRLRSGVSKLRVLQELTESPEAVAKAALLTDAASTAAPEPRSTFQPVATREAQTWDQLLAGHGAAFLNRAYQTLLGREPDPEGLRFYLGQLKRGISKIQILAELRRSREARSWAKRQPARAGSAAAMMHRLDWEIRKFRLGRAPLFGPLFRAALGIEGNRPIEMRLRRLECLLALGPEVTLAAELAEADAILAPAGAAETESPTRPDRVRSDDTVDAARPATRSAVVPLRSLPAPARWGREKINA
jgi:hypothetical protein